MEALADGRHRVMSGERSLGAFDLVVGADGAWSRVRPLVSPETPSYTGVPPFSGEGVNMAMLDALELARRLAGSADWSAGVAGYEEDMFVRAAAAATGAMEGLSFVSEDALAHSLAHFAAITAGPEIAV